MKRSVTEAYEPAGAAARKRRRPSIMPLVVFAAQQRSLRGFERAIAQGEPRARSDHPAVPALEAPARGVRITDIA